MCTCYKGVLMLHGNEVMGKLHSVLIAFLRQKSFQYSGVFTKSIVNILVICKMITKVTNAINSWNSILYPYYQLNFIQKAWRKNRVSIQIVRKQKYFIAIFVYEMILLVVQNRLSSGGMENTTNYFQIINKKQRNYSISFSLLVPLNGKFCIHKIKRIYVFWFILWSLTLVYKPIPFT